MSFASNITQSDRLPKFGQLIYQWRWRNGLTQKQAGRKFDVKLQTVSAWETESRTPSIKLVPDLAKQLQISRDKLARILMDARGE